jgi:hypothetical protein
MASSKVLERKWREEDQLKHKHNLRTMRSSVAEQFHRPPYQHNPALRMAKREAVLESKKDSRSTYLGKYADIERENRILLDKMSNIMQDNKPKLYNPSKQPLFVTHHRKI